MNNKIDAIKEETSPQDVSIPYGVAMRHFIDDLTLYDQIPWFPEMSVKPGVGRIERLRKVKLHASTVGGFDFGKMIYEC